MKFINRALFAAAGSSLLFCSLLGGCSDSQNDDKIVAPKSTAPASSDVVLKGGGLRGLPKIAESAKLSATLMNELFALAYDGRAAGRVMVENADGELLDARPQVAFRTPQNIILLVSHASASDCHACSGSTSVYYFDTAGKRLVQGYPFSMPGAFWGQSEQFDIVSMGDGFGAVASSGSMWQGYACSFAGIFRFASGGPREVGGFTSAYDTTGAGGGTRVELQGAELDGGDNLKLRFVGRAQEADGSVKQIAEERVLTLDGVEDSWLSDWPYKC